jgi:tRNA pseudouridine13 synthase
VEDPEGLEVRATSFEISPSGPIFGKKMILPQGAQGDIENEVLQEEGLRHSDFHQMGPKLHLEGGRRPLRIQVVDLEWKLEGTDLYLAFFLRKGGYATTFLRELMKNDEPAPGFRAGPLRHDARANSEVA